MVPSGFHRPKIQIKPNFPRDAAPQGPLHSPGAENRAQKSKTKANFGITLPPIAEASSQAAKSEFTNKPNSPRDGEGPI